MRVLLLILVFVFLTCCSHREVVDVTKTQTPQAVQQSLGTTGVKASENQNLPYSPFEIKEISKKNGQIDLTRLWERVGLESRSFTIVSDDSLEVTSFFLNDDNDEDAVLGMWTSVMAVARFVVFQQDAGNKSEEKRWKYIGFVDVDYQQYGMPEFKVIHTANRSWLVLKELSGRGTGVSSYLDNFYEIKTGGLKSSLSYPSRGHETSGNIWDRQYNGQIIGYSDKAIEIRFSVYWNGHGYFDDKPPEIIFSQTKKGVFVWNQRAGEFVLNPDLSEISEGELRDVFSFDRVDEKLFLKYTFQNLLQISKKGNRKQKEWLKSVLKKLGDSPQKRQLTKNMTENL